MSKTSLMRVPSEFNDLSKKLAKKLGRKSTTEFLRVDGIRLFRNADTLSNLIGGFVSSKNKKRK